MLLGRDVSSKSPHRRARLGLGRTFQAARLYPELTVRDTVQLALEAQRRTSFWASLAWLPSIPVERAKRSEAAELIDFLGLAATAIVTSPSCRPARAASWSWRRCSRGAPGDLPRRADRRGGAARGRGVRAADPARPAGARRHPRGGRARPPVILSISSRVYCLEAGRVIAMGLPDEVRDDPRRRLVSRHRRARSSARTLDSGQPWRCLPPLASVMSVAGSQSPVPLPALELNVTSRAAPSAAYCPCTATRCRWPPARSGRACRPSSASS